MRMTKDGYTVSELAQMTKKTRHAVEQWLSLHKIKPISYEARYPAEILDMLSQAKRGRPAKKTEPSAKPPKKPRQTKK